jgi:hypothetical protein
LVIITTHQIPLSRRCEFEALAREYLEHVDANEPRTQVHWAYVDDAKAEVSLLQVHPDAESADHHMVVSGELIGRGLSIVDTVGVEVYGEPGPVLRGALDANASSGVPVTMRTGSVVGVVRS